MVYIALDNKEKGPGLSLSFGSQGFLLAAMKVIPSYSHRQENKRKLQAVELPSCSIPLLLIIRLSFRATTNWKLPTYPSPKPSFCPRWAVSLKPKLIHQKWRQPCLCNKRQNGGRIRFLVPPSPALLTNF